MTKAELLLVRQAILHVIDSHEWDFSEDEDRMDFADKVQEWLRVESSPYCRCGAVHSGIEDMGRCDACGKVI